MQKIQIFFFVVIMLPTFAQAQSGARTDSMQKFEQYLRFDTTESLEFLVTLFPPFLIQNGMELKEFVRSEEFRQLKSSLNDLKAVDAIFVKAMQLTHNNTGIALLLTTLACFDHRMIRFDMPVFLLAAPLSDESEEEFDIRVKNLPTKLFPDSPRNRNGDRDKLQHFFGSAFITYVFDSRDAADRIGNVIEHGEKAFIIGGAMDDRDYRTNTLGQEFGIALMNNIFQYPSKFLRHAIAVNDSLRNSDIKEIDNGFDSCR